MLWRGVLTAKYNPDAPPDAESRAGRGDKRMLEAEWHPASIALAQKLAQHAAARGVASAHLAIQWVLRNPIITGAVVGPRTEAQLADYISALDCAYTPEDEAVISGLVTPASRRSTAGVTVTVALTVTDLLPVPLHAL